MSNKAPLQLDRPQIGPVYCQFIHERHTKSFGPDSSFAINKMKHARLAQEFKSSQRNHSGHSQDQSEASAEDRKRDDLDEGRLNKAFANDQYISQRHAAESRRPSVATAIPEEPTHNSATSHEFPAVAVEKPQSNSQTTKYVFESQ